MIISIFAWQLRKYRLIQMHKFIKILNKNHPRSILAYDHIRLALILAVLIFSACAILKPFFFKFYPLGQRIFLVLFTTLSAIIGVMIAVFFIQQHKRKEWLVYHEILNVLICITSAWIFTSLFYLFLSEKLLQLFFIKSNVKFVVPKHFWSSMFQYVFGIGFVVYGLTRLYDVSYLVFKEHNPETSPKKQKNKLQQPPETTEATIKLLGKNKGEVITIPAQKFVYAKVEGHYVEVFYITMENKLESLLFRMTLKEIEQSLNHINHIRRSHRSYIVNVQYILNIVTLNQKHYGPLKNGLGEVLISRDLVKIFRDLINN